MSTRGIFSNIARSFGLIYSFDKARYYYFKNKNKGNNKRFLEENPSIALPPDYLMYESFQIDYKKYYNDSLDSAKELVEVFGEYHKLDNISVLDWGCGPARIIRHLPNILGENCKFYGTDYNKNSIKWCQDNIKGIEFNLNSLEAKLPYADNSFDIIYGISIFTHLSEKYHYDWYNELLRVLKPGGIMYQSSHGDNFLVKLTEAEKQKYNRGELVVRGQVKEGHRTFTAFHPNEFMEKLFKNVEILEHIVHPMPNDGSWVPQDAWVIRK